MTWSLKWGAHVKAFEAQAKKTGIKSGPLLNRPRLQRQDVPYYIAFNSLSQARPQGMNGSGPIPVSEILALCQLVGIANQPERVKYLNLIQQLDYICLEHWASERSKQTK